MNGSAGDAAMRSQPVSVHDDDVGHLDDSEQILITAHLWSTWLEVIIATLVDALPPGSYLVASHLTTERDPVAASAGQQAMREAGMAIRKRDSGVFDGLAFSGLELVPPGVVLASEWRPTGTGPRPRPSEVNCYAGVAREP